MNFKDWKLLTLISVLAMLYSLEIYAVVLQKERPEYGPGDQERSDELNHDFEEVVAPHGRHYENRFTQKEEAFSQIENDDVGRISTAPPSEGFEGQNGSWLNPEEGSPRLQAPAMPGWVYSNYYQQLHLGNTIFGPPRKIYYWRVPNPKTLLGDSEELKSQMQKKPVPNDDWYFYGIDHPGVRPQLSSRQKTAKETVVAKPPP